MEGVVSFEEARVSRNISRECLNPYSPQRKFTYDFSDLEISAMNFILSYLNQYQEDIQVRLNRFIGSVLNVNDALFRNALFYPRKNFRWYLGQEKSININCNFTLKNPELFNDIVNKFPNQGLGEYQILSLMVANYIENFHNFFNGLDCAHVVFPDKKTTKFKAIKRGEKGLVEILEDNDPNPLIFLGVGKEINNYRVGRLQID